MQRSLLPRTPGLTALRVARCAAAALAIVFTADCADAHDGALGVPAPGEPAAIVIGGVSWAGGLVLEQEARVDSATMQFRVRWCQGESIGAQCDLNAHVVTGAAHAPSVAEIFRLHNTSEFRSLRAEYVAKSGVLPPDPSWGWLDITANGRYRRISWSEGATLPVILSRVQCAMLAAVGSLVLCD